MWFEPKLLVIVCFLKSFFERMMMENNIYWSIFGKGRILKMIIKLVPGRFFSQFRYDFPAKLCSLFIWPPKVFFNSLGHHNSNVVNGQSSLLKQVLSKIRQRGS